MGIQRISSGFLSDMPIRIEPTTKIVLKVIGLILVTLFLWMIREVILLFLFAVVLASAMEPLVTYFKGYKIPRGVSVLTVYILFFALVGLVVSLIVPPLIQQSRLVFENLPLYLAELSAKYPFLQNIDLSTVAHQIIGGASGETVLSRTVDVFSAVVSVLTVLVVSFYLVVEEKSMKVFISELAPEKHRELVFRIVTMVQQKMGMWVLGQLFLSLSIFLCTFLGLSILGVKYALFLAMLAGVLEVIPFIGPTLSAVPALFFALVQSPPLALAVLILYILVQKFEGWVLVPKIMQKTVGTSPLVVLLALLIGFQLGGVLGLLLAVPLASALTVIVKEWPKIA